MVTSVSTADLLGAGYALVPIPYRQKKPVLFGWQHRHQVITCPSKLELLIGMNLGLAHAYCDPVPTCALDIDNYPLAVKWLADRGVDLRSLLEGADSVVIWSGKHHSLKLLYRLPRSTLPIASAKVVHGKKTTVLEFRCATKGGMTVQDVLPPSIHPSGTAYQWLGAGSPLRLPTISQELLTVWDGLRQKTKKRTHKRAAPFHPETPRATAALSLMLQHISADCDYETWRNLVWAVLSTQWSCAEDIAYKWSRSAPHRFSDEAFWLVANSYDPHYEPRVSVGTVYYHARAGGWHE